MEEARLAAIGAGSVDQFGASVAVREDTAVIGAPDAVTQQVQAGAAFVFTRSGTTWVESQRLEPSNVQLGMGFGTSVAIDGDTIVVGAPAGALRAAAYVFVHDGTNWVEQAELIKPDELVAAFATNVALDGDTILIGAYYSRYASPGVKFCFSGSAHVFQRTGTTWTDTQTLLASDAACSNYFGKFVALSDGTALIGDRSGVSVYRSGSGYVFTESGGVWTEQQKLGPTDPYAYGFGEAIAIDGDRAIIGAPWDDTLCPTSSGCDNGSAYSFRRIGTAWVEQERIMPSDAGAGAYFGNSIALTATTAVIGALYDDDLGTRSGSGYAFRWNGSSWSEEEKLVPSGAGPQTRIGKAVAVAGDTVLLGAEDGPAGANAGSAYAFQRRSASVTLRNAGSNPASYTCTPTVIGSPWQASVDLSTTGHSHAQVLGSTTPTTSTLPAGQVLLITDASVFELPLRPGPTASWTVPVPSGCALAGLEVSTQAAHLFGLAPYALSNARDLVVGF